MPQPQPKSVTPNHQPKQTLLILGILFIAINLRPAPLSVGPLISTIRENTGLSNSMLGLLTTLPLIAFGLVSTLTPLFTKRFGISITLAAALILITLGISVRSITILPALYLGTLLLGIGIAFGNVLLPSLVKRNFSTNSGFITSLYSAVMGVGAASAAGLSVPLAQNEQFGWRSALAIRQVSPFLLSLFGCLRFGELKRLKNTETFL